MCTKHCRQLEYCFSPFWKCSKCVVRHLGRPPISHRHALSFPLKQFLLRFAQLLLATRRTESMCIKQCYQLEYCICFPFCKCSKCVVGHLGRQPTSPSAYISLLLKNILVRCGQLLFTTRGMKKRCVKHSDRSPTRVLIFSFWKCSK